MNDNALLHPLIQAGLEKGRKRIARYKQDGTIDYSRPAGENLKRLIVRQAADFKQYQERQGLRDAEIARRKQREAEEAEQQKKALAYKTKLLQGMNHAQHQTD